MFEADPDPSKPKVFVTAAFMYPNSPAHMGHARTYLVADVVARYWRMKGYNVLFPMGFHYTGTPILAMAERIASGDQTIIEVLKRKYDVPPEVIDKMRNPLFLARYFHEESKKAMVAYGLSIDWRREFTTVDPEFRSFIHWQFRKLREKGYIEQGTHPVGWCPRHGMPVGAHDTQGDKEPDIGEFVAIYFRDDDGLVYPTATLRPETVLGVTNIWMNPSARYCIIDVEGGSRWVVGEGACERLKHQLKFRIVRCLEASSFIGKLVRNPVTGELVPILPASFVDHSFATGIVMSVPAHAPYDAIALIDLRKGTEPLPTNLKEVVSSIAPRSIIRVEGFEEPLALYALKRFGIASQNDRDKLDEATKFVYSTELSKGVMCSDIPSRVPVREEYYEVVSRVAGLSVSEAREVIKDALLKRGDASIVYEIINKPVYCRCGAEVVVKILENQWFINYGDPGWKELAKKLLSKMKIVPEEARAQFIATIDWLRRRACARTRGLGVPLPWDESWVIESLSDSTIYMAFYTVVHKIRALRVDPSKLDDEFWDYVMLGIGDPKRIAAKLGIDVASIEDIRREFDYWYPLDWRVSGKDLIPNHLTFFIFNHAAIFPENKWPRGVIANGWVLLRGGKMSKSRGNIVLLKDLVENWSPDVARLSMAMGAEVPQDFEISDDLMKSALSYIQRAIALIDELRESAVDRETGLADRWLLSMVKLLANDVGRDLENVRIRSAAIKVFGRIPQIVEEYLSIVEKPSKRVVNEVIDIWLRLLAPFTPFIAEELWSSVNGKGYVSVAEWPSFDEKEIDFEAVGALRIVERVVEDIKNIARATKRTKIGRVVVYAHPATTCEAVKLAIDGKSIREVGEALIKAGVPKDKAFRIAQRLLKISRELSDFDKYVLRKTCIDELAVLKDFSTYIAKKVCADSVEILSALDPEAPDLGGKKSSAIPTKPGIYIE